MRRFDLHYSTTPIHFPWKKLPYRHRYHMAVAQDVPASVSQFENLTSACPSNSTEIARSTRLRLTVCGHLYLRPVSSRMHPPKSLRRYTFRPETGPSLPKVSEEHLEPAIQERPQGYGQ